MCVVRIMINLLNVCSENTDILRVILFIKTLLNYLCFFVPFVLIILISIDFLKNVMAHGEDLMRKNLSIVIKRIVYCLIIFLIPNIVSASFSLIGSVGYVNCYTNADESTILSIDLSNADSSVGTLEDEPTRSNLDKALSMVDKLPSGEDKESYMDRIDLVEEVIIAQEKEKKSNEVKNDKSIVDTTPNNPSNPDDKASAGDGLWVAHMKNDKDLVEEAIKAGFWGIEVDVRQDGDVFKLYHDSKKKPYTGYNLDVFLDTCKKNNIVAVLDLKTVNDYGKMISLVKAKGMQSRTIYQTSTHNSKIIHNIDNNARVWILIGDSNINVNSSIVSNLKSVKGYIEGVNMRADHVDESDIKAVHALGLTFCSFSYNKTMYPGKSAAKLKGWGSDYLMANAIDE